jgi:hypothetical protein
LILRRAGVDDICAMNDNVRLPKMRYQDPATRVRETRRGYIKIRSDRREEEATEVYAAWNKRKRRCTAVELRRYAEEEGTMVSH